MLTIGVDVDLTLVRTDLLWENWLVAQGARLKIQKGSFSELPYDISQLYDVPSKVEPYDFWRQEFLYDGLFPLAFSQSVFQNWKEKGHKVVFISAIKGDHHKSKYYFLKKWFPELDGVILTKEKGFVNVDVMIDDRDDILNQFDGTKTLKIKFHTQYEQKEPSTAHFTIKDWQDERLLQL